jgi:hypothetical protein
MTTIQTSAPTLGWTRTIWSCRTELDGQRAGSTGGMFAPPLGQWYVSGMKVKTSVTLSEELLSAISAETDQSNRSAFIEEATWRYLRQRQREARDKREFERINEHADELNEEAFDVLEFQADV